MNLEDIQDGYYDLEFQDNDKKISESIFVKIENGKMLDPYDLCSYPEKPGGELINIKKIKIKETKDITFFER